MLRLGRRMRRGLVTVSSAGWIVARLATTWAEPRILPVAEAEAGPRPGPGSASATGAEAAEERRPIQPPPPFAPYQADPSRRALQERIMSAVVGIRARLPLPQIKFRGKRRIKAEVTPAEGTGSGIVIDPSGLILTCAHVVGGAGKPRVFLADEREVEGTVTVYDVTSDLALVKVDAGTLPALDLGGEAQLRGGQTILLASRPGGHAVHFIEGVLAMPGVYHLGHSQLEFFRRFEARIEPGDSGGVLVDENGQFVGVVSVGLSDGRTGYAITREFIRAAMARLRMGPPVVWPWIGLAVEDIGQGGATRVWSVLPGSPAQSAGVRQGDVLVAIDGKPIDHFLTAMLRVATRPIGSRFELSFAREPGDKNPAAPRKGAAPAGEGDPSGLRRAVTVLSGPRAIVPALDPLDLFERETGIRLEVIPPTKDGPGALRAAVVPEQKDPESAPCRVGSRLVGVIPGVNLLLALEEGRTDQEVRTTNPRELAVALRAAAVGERVAAALIWETEGHRATMFLSGDVKRYAIL